MYLLRYILSFCDVCSDYHVFCVSFLAVKYNETAVHAKLRGAPTVTALIRFPHSAWSDNMTLTKGTSNGSMFELDKLRGKTSFGFDSSDLGNWIVYHIVSKYNGVLDISNDSDRIATISFEFPYACGECALCKMEEAEFSDLDIIEHEDNGKLSRSASQNASQNGACDYEEVGQRGCHGGAGDGTKGGSAAGEVELPPMPTTVGAEEEVAPASPPSPISSPRLYMNEISLRANLSGSDAVKLPIQSHLRLLVVDDVPSNRKILSRLLTKQGHTCFPACDGAEVLKMIIDDGFEVDAICMDYEVIVYK
jgi:CheY-like chemotaxis protein